MYFRHSQVGRRGARFTAIIATALALALSGCASVPTSGPVEHHTQQAPGGSSGVNVDPQPPALGAGQLLVVEGFLHAMSNYQPDYAVARQYLTEAASAAWQPESAVQIYADGTLPAENGQTVMLVGPVVGNLDSAGSYLAVSQQLRHDFALVRDANEQWRISNPPDGLLVSRYPFSTGFTPVTLYFMDATGSVLVPDQRYFASGEQALTAAARAVLAGPSARLAPAVRASSSNPIGVQQVTLNDEGLAEVTLSSTGLSLGLAERQAMLAELVTTLSGFAEVNAVTVTVGGVTLANEGGLSELSAGDFAELSPDNTAGSRALFAVAEDGVSRLREDNWLESTPVEADLLKPERLAVRSDLTELAAITDGGSRLVLAPAGTAKARVLRTGSGLLRPDFARNGELWSATSAGVSSFRVYRDDVTVKVDASDLPKHPLVASKLSSDGSRLALVLLNGTRTEVGVAVVVRAGDGIRLTGWRPLEFNLSAGAAGTALDLGWASRSQSTGRWPPADVAVLQRTDAGDTSVIRVSEDGATATDIGPTKAASLTRLAVIPGRPAVALTEGGTAYRFESEFSWALALTAVDDLAYSG